MEAVDAVALDGRGDRLRILVGANSQHWGPSVVHIRDLDQLATRVADGAEVYVLPAVSGGNEAEV